MAQKIKAVEKVEALTPKRTAFRSPNPVNSISISSRRNKPQQSPTWRRFQSPLPVHNMAAAKDFVRLHPDEQNYWSDRTLLRERADQGPEAQYAAPDRPRTWRCSFSKQERSNASVSRSRPSPATCSSSARSPRRTSTTVGTTRT